MSGGLVQEVTRSHPGTADAPVRSWARLNFSPTAGTVSGAVTVELGEPALDEPAVRAWRRDGTPGGDARIILSWLCGNAITDQFGVDTDLLVQLFIETAVNSPAGRRSCDGEYLATLAGAAGYGGATASSEWTLILQLAPDVVEATLAAIADRDPRWRYAIIAARDPESPAGRVRQTLLADLDR